MIQLDIEERSRPGHPGPGMTAVKGGCQCGLVRYRLRGQPVRLYVCHCLDDTGWLQPADHVWVSRAQPWFLLDRITGRTFAREPDGEQTKAGK